MNAQLSADLDSSGPLNHDFPITESSFHRFSDLEWVDHGPDIDPQGDKALESARAWSQQPRVRRVEDPTAQRMVRELIHQVRATHHGRHDFDVMRPGGGGYRVNRDPAGDAFDITLRRQPGRVPYLEKLILPNWWRELHLDPNLSRGGLILVAGEMGSGKSYTLASAIQTRTRDYGGKALCIEDPIELDIAGDHGGGIIRQKNVDYNVPVAEQFEVAMRAIRRKYPAGSDIPKTLMLGEIRDAHSAGAMVRAANIGCLCYATVHGDSPRNAIASALNWAAGDMGMDMARDQLGSALRMAMHQRLVTLPGGDDRRAVEGTLLWSSGGSHGVGSLIRDGKLSQLITTYETQNRVLQVKRTWAEVQAGLA